MNRKTPNFYQEKEKSRQKWIIAYLFVNATTEDFKNPILYLKRRISFLKDHTFSFLKNGIEIEVGKSFQGSKLKIQREEASISMETPFKINFSLQKEINNRVAEYSLPSIYYAIDKDTCYIYSIMNPKEKKEKSEEEKKYQKKMNRILYKLNNNLSLLEMKEYYDYKEGKEEYYPEGNISDITHSFVLSLSIFISLLQAQEIHNIKAVTYLPLRYDSRWMMANSQKDNEKKELLQERNNQIQTNITNKFIRTFRRLAEYNKNLEIITYPYETDEFLTMKINFKNQRIENDLLEDANQEIVERNSMKNRN